MPNAYTTEPGESPPIVERISALPLSREATAGRGRCVSARLLLRVGRHAVRDYFGHSREKPKAVTGIGSEPMMVATRAEAAMRHVLTSPGVARYSADESTMWKAGSPAVWCRSQADGQTASGWPTNVPLLKSTNEDESGTRRYTLSFSVSAAH